MEYTEKEKKGIDKVERMNKLFDKILLPAVGVLIIMLLLSFIVRKYREKFGSDHQPAAEALSQQTEPEVFALRRSLLAGYSRYRKEFEAYGYQPAEGFSYETSLCKTVDEELSIFQFADSKLGELTIINYIPQDKKSPYESLSMAISSYKLITVTVRKDKESHSVTFLTKDFSSYPSDQKEAFEALMQLTNLDEITTLYEIFETDISNLAQATNTG